MTLLTARNIRQLPQTFSLRESVRDPCHTKTQPPPPRNRFDFNAHSARRFSETRCENIHFHCHPFNFPLLSHHIPRSVEQDFPYFQIREVSKFRNAGLFGAVEYRLLVRKIQEFEYMTGRVCLCFEQNEALTSDTWQDVPSSCLLERRGYGCQPRDSDIAMSSGVFRSAVCLLTRCLEVAAEDYEDGPPHWAYYINEQDQRSTQSIRTSSNGSLPHGRAAKSHYTYARTYTCQNSYSSSLIRR
jgi:hypothetical protein